MTTAILQPQPPDHDQRLAHNVAGHLRVALHAFGEDDGHFHYLEALPPELVRRFNLEAVTVRADGIEVNGLERPPPDNGWSEHRSQRVSPGRQMRFPTITSWRGNPASNPTARRPAWGSATIHTAVSRRRNLFPARTICGDGKSFRVSINDEAVMASRAVGVVRRGRSLARKYLESIGKTVLSLSVLEPGRQRAAHWSKIA